MRLKDRINLLEAIRKKHKEDYDKIKYKENYIKVDFDYLSEKLEEDRNVLLQEMFAFNMDYQLLFIIGKEPYTATVNFPQMILIFKQLKEQRNRLVWHKAGIISAIAAALILLIALIFGNNISRLFQSAKPMEPNKAEQRIENK